MLLIFSRKYFNCNINADDLLDEIRQMMMGNRGVIIKNNAKNNRWIADAQFDLDDDDDDSFGKRGFEKAVWVGPQLVANQKRSFLATGFRSATLHHSEFAKLVDEVTAVFTIASVAVTPGAVIIVKNERADFGVAVCFKPLLGELCHFIAFVGIVCDGIHYRLRKY